MPLRVTIFFILIFYLLINPIFLFNSRLDNTDISFLFPYRYPFQGCQGCQRVPPCPLQGEEGKTSFINKQGPQYIIVLIHFIVIRTIAIMRGCYPCSSLTLPIASFIIYPLTCTVYIYIYIYT